ncbi:MAG: TIGR02099 family protein [Gammaproteobacteria bacterium]|nr:MAG: TIGR02099 family protein [Gammaproteobacteria bacterium]
MVTAAGSLRGIKQVWRWLAGALMVAALLLALGLGVFRLAVELLPGYEQRLVVQLREATGLRLSFDSLYARVGRYGPEIAFSGARVLPETGEDPLISAEAGRVSLAIGRSLLRRRLEVGRFMLVRPRLHVVVYHDGAIRLVGQESLRRAPESARESVTLDRLPRGLFVVRDATLAVLDLRAGQGRFELTGVNVELERAGDEVAVDGRIELPRHLGADLEFEATVDGDLRVPDQLRWQARIGARNLDLAQWSALLPAGYPVPVAGRGSVEASARGTGRTVTGLRVQPRFAGLRLPSGTEFTRLAGELRLQREGDDFALEASGLELSRPAAVWQPSRLAATLELRDGRVRTASLRADYLRIENLAALVSLAPAGPAREFVVALAPRGELSDLDLAVTDAGPGRLPDITGGARFRDLGFEAQGRAPGLSGLDGTVEGRGDGGVVQLATRDGVVSWPLKWRAPGELREARGRLEWRRGPDGVRLWLDDAEVVTGYGVARGRLRLLLRPGETPLLDLSASVADADLTEIWRFLPIDRLKPGSIAWLDAALRGGMASGSVSVTGPTRGFPYRGGEGVFQATGRVTAGRMLYATGWPEAQDLEAELTFDGPSMAVVATRGTVAGLGIRRAEVASLDLRDAIFGIRISGEGDAGQAIRLLQKSPLAPDLGALFAGLSGSGPLRGEYAMYLPVRDRDRRAISVVVDLTGNTLRHSGQAAALEDLSGRFWVRDRAIEAPELTGSLLGGPVRIGVVTRKAANGDLQTEVDARGRLTAEALRPAARLPVNAGIAGSADWHGVLTMDRRADPKLPATGQLRVSSDLRGLASDLPKPFAKVAEAARPLSIGVSFGAGSVPRVEARLGRDVQALLLWRQRPEDPPVRRGIVVFGGAAPAALPDADGLWLTGRLDETSLSDILELRWDEPTRYPLQAWFAGGSLVIRKFEALGYGFTNVTGRLQSSGRAWQVDLNADEVSGRVMVPHVFPGEVPMVLDLEHLRLAEPIREPATEPDPRELPSIQVDVRGLVFQGRDFGHLQAELTRGTAGLTMNRFTIRHAAYSASGHGSWLVQDDGQQCQLEFQADSDDVQGFLQAMQFGPAVAGRKGHLIASVTWPGPPERSAIERVSGRLEMSAADGRLVSVEPGAGRILGLMSLAHLPRRLALDFGDLTGEGLAFDTLRGTFALQNGEATTDDLLLRGSTAEIGIAGRTSLRYETYDQTAVVTGQVGASLGVAGALAAGPAVGAALLLFSQIFKEPLKGATRGYYRITGSWDDPQVKRIDARELKETRREPASG